MTAGSTYTPIATYTASGTPTTFTFSSIPQTYTDLVLIANFDGSASSYSTLTFNGVSGTSYSKTRLIGNVGNQALSDKSTNASSIIGLVYNTAGNPTAGIFQIMNYANTITYKTVLIRGSAIPDNTDANVGLFRGSTGSATDAITSITLTKSSGNYTVGSTFTLYGILAA